VLLITTNGSDDMNHEYNVFNPYLISTGFMRLEDCPAPGTFFPLRIVRWYEFELMHKSDQGYVVSRDQRINAQKGILMIRKPGMVVQGVSAYECNSIIFDSQFDPALIPFYQEHRYLDPTSDLLIKLKDKRLAFLDNLPDYIEVTDYPYVKTLFDQSLHIFLKQGDEIQWSGKQIIYMILTAILEDFHQKESRSLEQHNPNAYEAISKTKQFMETMYYEPITLSCLAKKAGYTKEAFSRLFKKNYGKSPIDYVIDLRLFHSKRMLLTTNKSIYEIAIACGFNNDTYFYTVFKQKEGLSPSSYRKSNRLYS